MIEIKNLSFGYKSNELLLKNLNLIISKEQKISIIGRSGCGKTTLLMLLAGIISDYEGRIIINNENLTEMRSETGVVFQNGGLFPWKTVYGNLALGLKAKKVDRIEIDRKISRVLKDLGIDNLKNKYLKELSGGQKQRVAIARTLVLDSDILLLDEPSASLDAFTKDNFQNILLKIYNKYQLCSVLVTHDIEEAVLLGQNIVVMKDGKLEKIIDNEELFGKKDIKNQISFYERCINLRKTLE